MRSIQHLIMLVALVLVVLPSICFGAESKCSPQCVPWARDHSEIKLHALRPSLYANTLPEAAMRSSEYKIIDKPKKRCIMVIDTPVPSDHVIAVQESDKKDDGKYSLRVTHSNFNYKERGTCDNESNVKATYDKKKRTIKFRSGAWEGKELRVIAIIDKK